uniref:Elapor1/2 mannose 6-phosphate receptor homology domain-containing protein n=1 Tax=Ditylenchus dipsaci TaxID=166011 RepID=A0A915DAE1_9BILA
MHKDLKCVKCPAGTALNLTSSRQGPESCIACGPNLGSEDGSACSFSGRFELPNRTLTAEGIKVYAREGNSYFHSFNVSLFGEPVYCRDSFDSGSNSGSKPAIQTTLSLPSLDADDAVFCRSAAIPAINVNGSGSSNLFNRVLYVSSTIISRKLAAITQNRSYHGFHLSNEQLEYDTSLTSSSTARPIDVHLFYEPSTISMVSRLLNSVKDPLVRLSRKCPDGTCDGCVFHVIVESSYACPICHPDDFEEIRGNALTIFRRSIPYLLNTNIKLILLSAALLIAILVVTIVVFYQRNKSLEYRYMRIIEGKEPDNANSCGMESDDEEEEDVASSGTRVFFGKKKNNNYVVSVQSRDTKRTVKTDETAEFLSDSSES